MMPDPERALARVTGHFSSFSNQAASSRADGESPAPTTVAAVTDS